MTLHDWLQGSRGRCSGLAAHLRVYPSFVSKMANGLKRVPPIHATAIEAFTAGAVTRRDLRPDDWQQIWPELADAKEPA